MKRTLSVLLIIGFLTVSLVGFAVARDSAKPKTFFAGLFQYVKNIIYKPKIDESLKIENATPSPAEQSVVIQDKQAEKIESAVAALSVAAVSTDFTGVSSATARGQHYQCYDTKISKEDTRLPAKVILIDQFGKQEVKVTRILDLCTPTGKAHLTPIKPPVPPLKPPTKCDIPEDLSNKLDKCSGDECATIKEKIESIKKACVVQLQSQISSQVNAASESVAIKTVDESVISAGYGLSPFNHLECYTIKESSSIKDYPLIKATDQFGVEKLKIQKPVELCTPAQKLLANSKAMFTSDPPSGQHYKCYTVQRVKDKSLGVLQKSTVVLADQFGKKTVVVMEPELLCTPTEKVHIGVKPPTPPPIEPPQKPCERLKELLEKQARCQEEDCKLKWLEEGLDEKMGSLKKECMVAQPQSELDKNLQLAAISQAGSGVAVAEPSPIVLPVPAPGSYDHLKCYKIKTTVTPKIIYPLVKVLDQFGIEVLRPIKERLLCTPALKEVISSPSIPPPVPPKKPPVPPKTPVPPKKSKPSACTEIYDPVCGVDGKTYANSCFAKSAGVDVERKGKCEDGVKIETEIQQLDIKGDKQIEIKSKQPESVPFQPSVSPKTLVPPKQSEKVVCVGTYDPACGVDGKTYTNSCFAKSAGVEVKRKGKCEDGVKIETEIQQMNLIGDKQQEVESKQ